MTRKLIREAIRIATRSARQEKIAVAIEQGLPAQIEPALTYLVTGKTDERAASVVHRAEKRRSELAKQGDKRVPIWYSPKPDSAGDDVSADARPQPGKVLEFTMSRVAKTGNSKRWGTALHLIARNFSAKVGVELGACAGISAIYLASTMDKLITVEGSKALSEIAVESVSELPVKVVNSLFDDAIDDELPALGRTIDFVYIDGHHEKVATTHYFNRLKQYLTLGAVVLFDDVSWSHDMRDAWNELSQRSEFAHAIDLGAIGVCLMKNDPGDSEAPQRWDLQAITGRASIGNPSGWKEA